MGIKPNDIYAVLSPIYTRHFGEDSVQRMSRLLSDRLNMGDISERQQVQNYIWNWYPGGTTAEHASEKLMEAFPDYIKE